MIYFYDFENLGSLGFSGLNSLSAEDKVFILYSEKAHTIDVEVIDLFTTCKAEVKWLKTTKIYPNYADFHICTIVGAFAYQGKACAIISNDKGYVSVVDYWKNDFIFGKPIIVQFANSIDKIKQKDSPAVVVNEPVVPTNSVAKKRFEDIAKTIENIKDVKMEEQPVQDNNIISATSPTKDKIAEIMRKSTTLAMLKYNLITDFTRIEGLRIYEEVKDEFKRTHTNSNRGRGSKGRTSKRK